MEIQELKAIADQLGYELIKGHDLAKLEYNARSRAQAKPENALDPESCKAQLLSDIESPFIVDAGAYIGDTVNSYAKIFPRASIVAIEPYPVAYAQLCERVTDSERIECFNLALAESDGPVEFNVNQFAPTNSLLAAHDLAAEAWGEGLLDPRDVIAVPGRALDSLCSERAFSTIDLLKIDVQGAEFKVLCGAQGMLSRRAIRLIYLEVLFTPTYVQQAQLWQLDQLLSSNGYYLAGIFNQVYGDVVKQADFLYAVRGG